MAYFYTSASNPFPLLFFFFVQFRLVSIYFRYDVHTNGVLFKKYQINVLANVFVLVSICIAI